MKNLGRQFLNGILYLLLTLWVAYAAAAPAIGVAKDVIRDGRQVTIDFYVKNIGDTVLNPVALTDDLDATFGAGAYTLVSGPTFMQDPGTITLNTGFNGSADTGLIFDGSLAAGATAQIRIVVEIDTLTDQGSGLGVYWNQATAEGDEGLVSDLSDDGTLPDPNGNGNAGDAGEDDPSLIAFGESAVIGVAKNAVTNGNVVTFDVYLENLGAQTIGNLQVSDNLDAVFGAGNYSLAVAPTLVVDPGTFAVSGGFDGATSQSLVAPGATLASGARAQIRFAVNVTSVTDRGAGLGVYSNQVEASGQAPGGTLTSDLSAAGTDPDPNGNGSPVDLDENDPTVFVVGENPRIGVAKTASVSGSTVTFDFYLENLGDVALGGVTLGDDLDAVFGAGNYYIATAPALVAGAGTLNLNAAFNGGGDAALLAEGSTLAVGASAQLRVVVRLIALSDQGLGFGVYANRARAQATGPSGGFAGDFSDDGTDPDPNGNGDPSEAGEDDLTAFTVAATPVIGLAKEVSVLPVTQTNVNVNGVVQSATGPRVVITWRLENLGVVGLTDITLTDALDAVFGAGNYGTVLGAASIAASKFPELVDGPATLVRNTSYNGGTNTAVLSAGSTLAPGEVVVLRSEVIVFNVTDQGAGLGIYENQASAAANGASGGSTSDLSDAGSAADANGNGDPTEAGEDDPTPFVVGAYIGAAQTATVVDNAVTFDLYLENLGTQNLSDVGLDSSLDVVFGAGTYAVSSAPVLVDDPGTLVLNPAYDGSGDSALLAAGGTLAAGDTAHIRFTVTVNSVTNRGSGIGGYRSQAGATAVAGGTTLVSDSSDNGTDPDPTGDGNPSSLGGNEDDATPFTLVPGALVGVAKTASLAGSTVTFDLYLENFGVETTSSLSLVDDLNAVFGAGNYVISSAPSLIVDPGTVSINAGYNGGSDTSLLGGGSSLQAGAVAQVRFVVDVTSMTDPLGLGSGVYRNQAVVTAASPSGLAVSDLSDDGTDPDPTGDGDPTYAGQASPFIAGENDPTYIVMGGASLGVALHSFVNGTQITFDYYLENLGSSTISGIGATQNLFSVFGFGNYSVAQAPVLMEGPATVAPLSNFDGTFAQTLLTGASLGAGESARIRFVINVTNVTNQGNGFGVYLSQFAASGTTTTGSTVSDTSDDGIVSDPNGNGLPGEAGENDPTRSVIGEEAIIGAAKTASVSLAGNQVTFDLYLENLGNVQLDNLSLADDLDAVFGAGNYTVSSAPALISDPGTITLEGTYDGSGTTELIAAGSSLAAGAVAHIRMVIDVTTIADQGNGIGVYRSQVIGSAAGPSATVAMDRSDNGTDPDPNGNGNPADAGEGDVTEFSLVFERVGIAKQATVSGDEVTFDYYVENLGNTTLSNFSLPDDLDAVFGAGNYEVVTAPFIASPRDLVANGSFDGSSDKRVVTGGSINAQQTEHIQLVVRVLALVDQGSGFGNYSNQVTVTAEGSSGTLTDLSDAGTEPDANGNGNAGDTGENDPTTFTVAERPVVGVAKLATVNGRHVVFDLYVEALGNVPLSNLTLSDDLDAVFGAGNYSITSAPSLVDDPGSIVLNGAFDGSTDTALIASGTLTVGDTAQIRVEVDVILLADQGSGLGAYSNQAQVSAIGPASGVVSDSSDNGTDPDPNGNGDPTEAGEGDPTTFTLVTSSSVTLPTATGAGDATLSFTGGGVGCVFTSADWIPLEGDPRSPPVGTAPQGLSFAHGLFTFTVGGTCATGATLDFTLTLPTAPAAGTTEYYKYGSTPTEPTPHWYVLPATISGTTVSFSITDGGVGDDDLTANGQIVDPGGPATAAAVVEPPTAIPMLDRAAMILLAALMVVSMAVVQRRRNG